MKIETDRLPARAFEGTGPSVPAGAAAECDWCGRPVRTETAVPRVHRGDAGDEPVYVCAACESGAE